MIRFAPTLATPLECPRMPQTLSAVLACLLALAACQGEQPQAPPSTPSAPVSPITSPATAKNGSARAGIPTERQRALASPASGNCRSDHPCPRNQICFANRCLAPKRAALRVCFENLQVIGGALLKKWREEASGEGRDVNARSERRLIALFRDAPQLVLLHCPGIAFAPPRPDHINAEQDLEVLGLRTTALWWRVYRCWGATLPPDKRTSWSTAFLKLIDRWRVALRQGRGFSAGLEDSTRNTLQTIRDNPHMVMADRCRALVPQGL